MFKRGRRGANGEVHLPDERKALVERYMIDAEEAEARTQRAAEEQARREEAEARAQRVAEEHARREKAQARHAAEEHASREEIPPTIAPEPKPDAVAAVAHAVVEARRPDPEPNLDPHEPAEDLPVYAWLERVLPKEPETADWTRELVKAREARGDELHRA